MSANQKTTGLRKSLLVSQFGPGLIALILMITVLLIALVLRDKFLREVELGDELIRHTQNIRSGLSESISVLRGYILLPEKNKLVQRYSVWQDKIFPEMEKLSILAEREGTPELKVRVADIDRELFYMQALQWWLEDSAGLAGRDQLAYLYKYEAAPMNDRLAGMVNTLVALERRYLPRQGLLDESSLHRKILIGLNDLRALSMEFSSIVLQSAMHELTEDDVRKVNNIWSRIERVCQTLDMLDSAMPVDVRSLYRAYVLELKVFREISKQLLKLVGQQTDAVLNSIVLLGQSRERALKLSLDDLLEKQEARFFEEKEKQAEIFLFMVRAIVVLVVVYFVFFIVQASRQRKRIVEPIENAARAISDLVANHTVNEPARSGIRELDALVESFSDLARTLLVTEDSLNSSQLYLTNILTNIGDGVIATNEEGVITLFNSGAESIFGYSAEEIAGRNVTELMLDEDRLSHPDYVSGSNLKSGDNAVMGVSRELMGRHKNGGEFPISVNLRVFSYNGKRSFVALIKDETQSRAINENLRLARIAAEQSSLSKSRFLADMSHDLRTPLNAIIGFSQLLQIDPGVNKEHKAYADDIFEAGNLLLKMIDEILDLSRIEAGKIEYKPSAVSVEGLFRNCQLMTEPLATKANITLHFDFPEDESLAIFVDETRFLQVMFNLISNAVKYNREGGGIEVYCTAIEELGRLRVSVKDTGIGIAPETLGQVFDAFSRVHVSQDSIKGTGIGLAITRRLVEEMGGEIDLISQEAEGSTFWVEFPRFFAEKNSENVGESIQKISSPDTSKLRLPRAISIVYVEDDQANRVVLERLMERQSDISLSVVDNATDGLSMIRDQMPDLVITDIAMPERDGYWLLAELRNDSATKNIPIIALSANATTTDVAKAKQAGFDVYQTKPFRMEQLHSNIKEVVFGDGNA